MPINNNKNTGCGTNARLSGANILFKMNVHCLASAPCCQDEPSIPSLVLIPFF